MKSPVLTLLAGLSLAAVGCTEEQKKPTEVTQAPIVSGAFDEPDVLLPSELRRRLKVDNNVRFRRVGNEIVAAELPASGVESIEPLRGLPLTYLDLGLNNISDISALKGMPLKHLVLENCPVKDISVLKGMPLEILYLQETKVTDLSVLEGMPLRQLNLKGVAIDDISMMKDFPLEILWLPDTNVSDISPLAGTSLISLDIEGTPVTDISALAEIPTLQRLNICQTRITDLRPLAGLSLTRITLTPERITDGMDILRNMTSLGEIRISMEGDSQSAGEFWRKYDEGVWSTEEETSPGATAEGAGESSDGDAPTDEPADTATSDDSK